MGLHALRTRLADGEDSWGARRRQQRAGWLAQTFPDLAQMSIIDLGGRVDTWLAAPVRPARVHVVNLEPAPADVPDWAEVDHGDACALPAHLAARRYDLVFSNSVLEHVGGHERRVRFAEAVHALSDAHWVQTPYRYFPIEPHWIAPGMQFLPLAARASVARRWPLAHSPAKTRETALRQVLWTELVDRTQMRHYFPESRIRVERLLGVPKSLIAIRTPAD
ncbi:class I SAM-dependent methyltransferase [Solwaraspora sp. WMMD1047]|uniref:methyltransferase domain-containing protein n=1 Tax=Solwaraspora sp. WMMD1047 TaxID=3016102 RepID=UPI002417D908|nr:class I SAM-dependent methyltransferase [Solwaraspora sp. WMMD1047]MDG4828816.1 class I SAM-dependent methyltransferase [Solwaraspora sp. WMMD1047]